MKQRMLTVVSNTLMQNAFPLHPIVTDSLVSFQHKGQLSFIEQMNQKGIRSLLFTMNLVHFKFLGASLS